MKFELKPFNRGASDEEMLEDLRRVAALNNNRPLSQPIYQQSGGLFHPCTIARHFGKWNKALERAGLPAAKIYSIEREQWFENIALVWYHFGKQPSYSDMRKPPSTLSPEGYANKFGGWRKALEAFVEDMGTRAENTKTPAHQPARAKTQRSQQIKRTPRSVNWRLRHLVLMRDGCRCQNCGRSPANEPGVTLEIDHDTPWSEGGETTLENLRTLCQRCNGGKSNLTI